LVVEDGSISVTGFREFVIEELGVDWVESEEIVIESTLEVDAIEDIEHGSVEYDNTSLVHKEEEVAVVEHAFHSGVEGGVQGLEETSIEGSLGSLGGHEGSHVLVLVAD